MNQKSTSPIPEAIVQLQRQLDQFRSTQPRRTKLPESLWQAAVELARQHGVYPVAHPLRLDYTRLKERLGGSPNSRRKSTKPAFVELVARYQASLLRLARIYVASAAVAEEVAQDTWLAVLRGLDGFGEQSMFRTWLLQILVNRARSTGVREHRSVAIADAGPAVDASRFDASGAWMSPPQHWVEDTDDRVLIGPHGRRMTPECILRIGATLHGNARQEVQQIDPGCAEPCMGPIDEDDTVRCKQDVVGTDGFPVACTDVHTHQDVAFVNGSLRRRTTR